MLHLPRRAFAPAHACWLLALPAIALAQEAGSQVKQLGVVVVTGSRVSSLPSQIPTTVESIDAARIEATINATDSEDVLKYFPSLLVRKRYAGDYNHAVLSTRASGTGNSARSLVYADGILLSNLLGNGASFAPRWGLVTPEEIERVDVLYGPFSAAYPGNSVGAVVDYLTRMPTQFEAHAKVGVFTQAFELYDTQATYSGWQTSASLGSFESGLSWWLNLNRLDSESQPLAFTTQATPVAGAVPDTDRFGKPWYITGTTTQYHTVQDHLKLKLGHEFTPALRVAYTLGGWRNDAQGQSESYVTPAAHGTTHQDSLEHLMQAVSLKSRNRDVFGWELAASQYRYVQDRAARGGIGGGAGAVTDLAGTGWWTLALRGNWHLGEHAVDAGLQQDSYRLRTGVYNLADWLAESNPALASRFDGDSRLQSVYAQDAWRFSPEWVAVLGLRVEHWQAWGGVTQTGSNVYEHPERSETVASPKLALSRELSDSWVLKASAGRAVRFPTVSELYQGAATAGGISNIANPDLRPEKSWTGELSSEWMGAESSLRLTLFGEDTRDAIYSQALPGVTPITNSVQNIDHVRTLGLEAAWQGKDVLARGVDAQASMTYADSKIIANSGYVSVPGDTIGKWQPRVPRWRATALVSWRPHDQWTLSYGARYSGLQYGTLDNSDINGPTYMGVSKYFTTDLRLRYAISKQWHAAFGIDNLNNYKYWNFHPYPQRTYSAELQFDL